MLNIAVIGAGYWGPNLIRNLSQINKCTLKYVCDLNKKKLQKIKIAYPEVTITTDINDILNDVSVDAVVLATNVNSHFKLGQKILQRGKHILIEKPLTIKSANSEKLIELAEKKKLVLMVGHTFLYNNAVQYLKKTCNTKKFGDILSIDSARLNLGLFQEDINVIYDLAPHDISIINYILDMQPKQVFAYGKKFYTDFAESVYIMLEYDFNIAVTLHLSWLYPTKIRKMSVVGKKQMIIYDDIQLLEKIKIVNKRVDVIDEYKSFGEFNLSYFYGDIIIPRLKQKEPLRSECQDFIDAIINNRKPFTDGINGWNVVKVLEAATKSLKTKKWVKL